MLIVDIRKSLNCCKIFATLTWDRSLYSVTDIWNATLRILQKPSSRFNRSRREMLFYKETRDSEQVTPDSPPLPSRSLRLLTAGKTFQVNVYCNKTLAPREYVLTVEAQDEFGMDISPTKPFYYSQGLAKHYVYLRPLNSEESQNIQVELAFQKEVKEISINVQPWSAEAKASFTSPIDAVFLVTKSASTSDGIDDPRGQFAMPVFKSGF